MASISKDKKGNRTIQFIAADRKRRSIRLGKLPQRAADVIKAKVEALSAASIAGVSWDKETAAWVGSRERVLYDKLASAGLVPKRGAADETRLGPFLDGYIKSRQRIKPNSVYMLTYARNVLVDYLGPDKRLADVTEGDADLFRQHLSKTVSENTVRTHCNRARQFFVAAVRHRLIEQNPFGRMRDMRQLENRDRMRFIPREVIDPVIEQLADPEMRLIVALARYGALRIPSEPLAMKWGDVDWERNRLTVRSVKTERHEGKATRVIPLFAEIRTHLEAVYDAADEGTEFVIVRHRILNGCLKRRLEAACKRAGVECWPKPFHNLRSTRETELCEMLPGVLHVVCQWVGHNLSIAARNYLQTNDVHFELALHNPVQQRAAVECDTRQ